MISLKSLEKHYNKLKDQFENETISLYDARINAVTLLGYVIDVCDNIENVKLSEQDKKTFLAYKQKLELLIKEIDILSENKSI